MDFVMDAKKDAPPFRARSAGIILLTVLVVLLLGGASLNSAIEYFQTTAWWNLSAVSAQELSGIKRIANGLISPFLIASVTLILLRKHFPEESIQEVAARFGLGGSRVSLRVAIPAFFLGMAYILFFTKVLMVLIPPDEFTAPPPLSAISEVAVWAQLIFALNVVTVVPVVEEFFFRGVLYVGFWTSFGKAISAVIVSLAFIAFHPDWLRSGYWVTHTSLYIIPFILVAARELTGGLTGPIFIHAGINFAEAFLP